MIHEVRFLAQPGTRRRAGLVFGQQPIYLEVLPPEVAADPHLRVRELEALPTGAHLTVIAGAKGSGPLPGIPTFKDLPPHAKSEVTHIKGVGPGSAKVLAGAGLGTVGLLAAASPSAIGAVEGLQPAAMAAIREWLAGPEADLLRTEAAAAPAPPPAPPADLKPERVQ